MYTILMIVLYNLVLLIDILDVENRYDKHIRYESRKVRAESRMRIKGRFVRDETQK